MSMPDAEEQVPHPAPGVVFQRVPDGAVLLQTSTETYFGLNAVGAEAWELLSPAVATMGELARQVGLRHPEVPPETVLADLSELLDELRKLGLVADSAGDADLSAQNAPAAPEG